MKTPNDVATYDFIIWGKPLHLFWFPGRTQYKSVSGSLPAAYKHFFVSV